VDGPHGMGAGRGRRSLGRVCHRGDAAMIWWWVVGVVVCAAIVWCVP
jgi:hypothetical protein